MKPVNEKIDSLIHQVASLTRKLDVVTAENITLKKKVIVLEARLLRELTYLSELDTSQTWSLKVGKLLREAIHKRKNGGLGTH